MIELPAGFIDRLKNESPGLFDGLGQALTSTEPVTAIRANAAKGYHAVGRPVLWCPEGIYLDERPVFTLDPALHQGRYYVQDASSMIISLVARQLSRDGKPLRWLDACAAPGGKTTCAIGALPEGSLVVANEFDPRRAAALKENVIKWGSPPVIVTRGDSRAFAALKERFDVVAADVPCSGEGMMRKDADARAQWSPGLIAECARRQREIVTELWKALKPGGHMIYSTCTFNRAENEDIVNYIISSLGGRFIELEDVDPAWGIVRTDAGYRFIPGRTEGEGLFVALIEKPGTSAGNERSAKLKPDSHPCRKWLNATGAGYEITTDADRINAFPTVHSPLLRDILKTRGISVIHHGTVLARAKGRDLVPDHSLALSTILDPQAFPSVDLNKADALAYLSCEPITIPASAPKGHLLLTFDGCPLGFVKNLGNRSNSLYPRDWRIRMSR